MNKLYVKYKIHTWCLLTSIVSFAFGWLASNTFDLRPKHKQLTITELLSDFKTFFPELIFLMLFGGMASLLIRATLSRESDFDVLDFITSDSKADPMKFGYLIAVLVLSWGFFALVFKDKLTEWYVLVFAGALLTGKVTDTYLHRKYTTAPAPTPVDDPPPPPPRSL